MTRERADRLGGAVVTLMGIVIAIEARTFTVGFLTDPVGPKALPYVVAVLLMAGGMSMAVQPARQGEWPSAATWWRNGLAAATFVSYAVLLPILGFLLTTWGCLIALGQLFGGPWRRNLVVSAIYTAALYIVFGVLLRLTLPVGSLFVGGAA